jgi:diadenosine tetraphosphate (Ap4A) HIT family hydrolase
VAKKIVKASGAEDYNILQNNGRVAHQMVDHVHFHVVRLQYHPCRTLLATLYANLHQIPKPNEKEGLGIQWPAQDTDMEKTKALFEELKSKM